jgi:[protein-PII] uridylyltransferase
VATSLQARQDEARAKLRLYAVPENAQDRLWKQLDDPYFLRHEPQEIAWHTRVLYYRVDKTDPVGEARLSPAGEGLQVMIYVPTRRSSSPHLQLFRAHQLRHFRGEDLHHEERLCARQLPGSRIRTTAARSTATSSASSSTTLGERLALKSAAAAAQQAAALAPAAPFPDFPEVNIQPDEKGTYWVLSVLAGDRPGLLSRVARVLTAYDVNLHTAKINTLGARAEDVFLVSGAALKDRRRGAAGERAGGAAQNLDESGFGDSGDLRCPDS